MGSQRPHYAVEKRYRSTLNENYAALARTLSSEAIQRICGTESRDGPVQMEGTSSGLKDEKGAASRQRKTATLSETIETISIITRCCTREAKNLEQLRSSVEAMRNRVQQMLDGKPLASSEHHGGEQGQL